MKRFLQAIGFLVVGAILMFAGYKLQAQESRIQELEQSQSSFEPKKYPQWSRNSTPEEIKQLRDLGISH